LRSATDVTNIKISPRKKKKHKTAGHKSDLIDLLLDRKRQRTQICVEIEPELMKKETVKERRE
jgi:plasmid replication initiation protein